MKELFVPGRIDIIGGITDLVTDYLDINKDLIPGHAISMPIDKGIYSKYKINKRIKVKYKDKLLDIPVSKELLMKEIEEESFFSYICGVYLYMLEKYQIGGIYINIYKMTLPIKKGLSSSAAICISIAKALNDVYFLKLSDKEIKDIAYNGEHLAHSKCGRLDQESIMNKGLCYITFYKDKAVSKSIKVKKDINFLLIDLNGEKDTRCIMDAFKNALPFPKNENDMKLHDIFGKKNKRYIDNARKAIINGDIDLLGESLRNSQKLIDNASVACKEYIAPVFHNLIKDEVIKKLSKGEKAVGSCGDGSCIMLCETKKDRDYLFKYIKEQYKMGVTKYKIKKSD